MDLEELRKTPHLSASGIQAYLDCSLQFKFSRIDKYELESTSDALELGSAVHSVLADFHDQRMIGVVPTLNELLEAFEAYWKEAAEENDDIEYDDDEDFETLLEKGKGLLRAYHQKLPDDYFTVLAIEQPFRFHIDDIPIVGVFDLIEEDPAGAIIIVDFKTSSRAYSRDQIDNHFQMTLYDLAAKAGGFADREILLRLDVLIKTRKPKFEQYYTTRSELDERRAIKKIRQVWKGINSGVYIPNDGSWRCNFCGFKTYCNEWFEKEDL